MADALEALEDIDAPEEEESLFEEGAISMEPEDQSSDEPTL